MRRDMAQTTKNKANLQFTNKQIFINEIQKNQTSTRPSSSFAMTSNTVKSKTNYNPFRSTQVPSTTKSKKKSKSRERYENTSTLSKNSRHSRNSIGANKKMTRSSSMTKAVNIYR